MKICITGATGYIGQNLISHLVSCDHQILVLARPASDTSIFSGNPAIFIYKGSLAAAELTLLFIEERVEAVIHLAAISTIEHRADQIPSMIDANVKFGTEIAQACVEAGVEFFINTGTTYQHFKNQNYLPVCLYAATKQAFEDILLYYTDSSSLKVVSLELCDTYGPKDNRHKILSVIVEAVVKGQPVSLSPGEQILDLVNISDVVSSYTTALEYLRHSQSGTNAKFQISSSQVISIRELAKLVENIAHKKIDARWGERQYRKREVMEPWMSTPILPTWFPKIKLNEGIKNMISEFEEKLKTSYL